MKNQLDSIAAVVTDTVPTKVAKVIDQTVHVKNHLHHIAKSSVDTVHHKVSRVIDQTLVVKERLDSVAMSNADSVQAKIGKAIGFNTRIQDITADVLFNYINHILEKVIGLATNIVLAILAYFIGKWLITRIHKILFKIFSRRHMDKSLRSFLRSVINIALNLILLVTIIGILGIETSSFVALFASAGVAIGLALSGTLQNFAGGVMILMFKQFRVGHVIEAQGYTGTVKEIQIFFTILNTFDNKAIILPNGPLATGTINNITKEDHRRVEWFFGIAYGDNYDTAKALLLRLMSEDARILHEPAEPFVALSALADSSVQIKVRAWVKSDDFWDVFHELNERVYKEFPAAGLNIPFPQMDVHLKKEN